MPPALDVPVGECVDDLLWRTWAADPDAPAVVALADGARLTRADLRARAVQLATVLREHGVDAGRRVAIYLDRGPDLVVAQAASMLAGGAHLALDVDDPLPRTAFMLADCAPTVLVTSGRLVDRLPATGAVVLLADDLPAADPSAPVTRPLSARTPDSPAYVVYTSGSTGTPKASLLPHRALAGRLRWLQRRYGLTRDDRVLYKTACGFDVSVAELYWPLTAGAPLVLAVPGGQRDPDHLADAILRHGVTTVHFVPALLGLFLSGRPGTERYPGLRLVLAAGEALAPDLVRRLHGRTDATVHNLYGPSECTVYATAWECPRDPDLDRVLIGSAVADTELFVLDEDRRDVPPGVPGELHLGGDGLALGYHDRPELTAARFVTLDRPDGPVRVYRTGDLVREVAAGQLEYLGRLDRQVKIRGNRVEPGEVEHAMLAVAGVERAAVVVVTDPGPVELAAFVQPGAGTDPETLVGAVRDAVRRDLPAYLIPASVTAVPELPVTPNGKLDEAALLRHRVAGREPAADAEAPAGRWEELVHRTWTSVLEVGAVGRDDDFFDLGGNSLDVAEVSRRLGDELRRAVPVRLLYAEPVLAEFAVAVADLTGDADPRGDADPPADPPAGPFAGGGSGVGGVGSARVPG